MKQPPDYQVRCSCGKRTVLHWSGSRYKAAAPEWDSHYPEGWTCGSANHFQRTPPTALIPYKQTPKLKTTL